MSQMKSMHFIITGEYITNIIRNLMLEHNLTKANKIFNELIPKPTDEQRKKILSGDAEFRGATICDDPTCEQCKGLEDFHLIEIENTVFKKNLRKHQEHINTYYIEIDGDMITDKDTISQVVTSQQKYERLKEIRNTNKEKYSSRDFKAKIIDAEDDFEFALDSLYQQFMLNRHIDYKIGSREWNLKLQVDGLVEIIKGKALTNKSVRELLNRAKEHGLITATQEVRLRESLEGFRQAKEELKHPQKPSKNKIEVGDFKIPKNLLDDYIESVKSVRTSMIIATSRDDPMIGQNSLQLRITRHKAIYKALKIPYYSGDRATDDSRELYDAIEAYIDKNYPEISKDETAKKLSRQNFSSGGIKP